MLQVLVVGMLQRIRLKTGVMFIMEQAAEPLGLPIHTGTELDTPLNRLLRKPFTPLKQ